MLFVLQTKSRKRRNYVFQTSFLFLILSSLILDGSHSITDNIAYAQAPVVLVNTQASTQTPAQIVSTKSTLTTLPTAQTAQGVPTAQVAQGAQTVPTAQTAQGAQVAPAPQLTQSMDNPINMTVSTIINTSPAQINFQVQSAIPVQTQAPVAIMQSTIPQNSILRSNYGQTPYAPSLERNIYLDSVWTALVPRKQLYEDPARKMQKSRVGRVITQKKKMIAPKNISKNTQENAKPKANIQADKIKMESGSHILIQPGSHVTVWADSPADSADNKNKARNSSINLNAQKDKNSVTAPVALSTAQDQPFTPNSTQTPNMAEIKSPIPNNLSNTKLSVEPAFGSGNK